MQTVSNASGSLGLTGQHFVTGASAVTALDTPQLSQTKLEIRNIVAEIAEFSASHLPRTEYLNAVLPRICSAMGATAAALWQCDIDSRCTLIGEHRLPDMLHPAMDPDSLSSEQLNHARILACVAAEGSGVLVPPKSVRMTADRPTNPLEECLLVVPIKVDDRFEMLLEVIQPPSGGPAAQRGYLRFVAQVADLMSDYLRRERLRFYALRSQYVELLQSSLLAIHRATSPTARLQTAASALADLLSAELVLLATPRRLIGWHVGWSVRAISHVTNFDTRSEIVQAAQQLLDAQPDAVNKLSTFSIVSTADLSYETSDMATDGDTPLVAKGNLGQRADRLRELLQCGHLGLLPLDDKREVQAFIALGKDCDLTIVRSRSVELVEAMRSLLSAPTGEAVVPRLFSGSRTQRQSTGWLTRAQVERWIVRASILFLLLAVAFFPTPDNIAALAVLESVDKEVYYAPCAAIVDEVYVDTHQTIKKGDRLIKLLDSQLQARYEELQGQKSSTASQLKYEQSQLKLRGKSREDELQISAHATQLDINLKAIEDQLRIVEKQVDALTIVARCDANVTTWDTQNQLRGRPVNAGQLLLTTCRPQAPWQLRITVPERQLGQLRDAMAHMPEGLTVQFALSSHPSEVRYGRLVKLSDQLFKDEAGVSKAMGIVSIDGNSLPAKSDGAVARATISCGRSYASWLAVRDAYREASAWWRLNW